MGIRLTQLPSPETTVDRHLELLREGLARRTYRGYPEPGERLVADPSTLDYNAAGQIILPDGPWTVDDHRDQPLPEQRPTPHRRAELAAEGYKFDAAGRPLHPWFLKMIADPAIGVVLGKGMLYDFGPQNTYELMIINNVKGEDYFLAEERMDTGDICFPGGFEELGETPEEGAKRELMEELNLAIPEDTTLFLIYEGLVADIRLTANAWQRTKTFLARLPNSDTLPEVCANPDEVKRPVWIRRRELLDSSIPYFGSHRFLGERALQALAILEGSQRTRS